MNTQQYKELRQHPDVVAASQRLIIAGAPATSIVNNAIEQVAGNIKDPVINELAKDLAKCLIAEAVKWEAKQQRKSWLGRVWHSLVGHLG